MSASKIFSFLFGILGTALMLLAVILCLTSLNGQVYMPQVPGEATACTDKLMEALSEGDYAAAEALLYGKPRLGESREAAQEAGQQLWQAYAGSFDYEFSGSCYGGENGVCRDVTITTLNIPSVTAALAPRAQEILDQKLADAQEVSNLNLVYAEDGSIRENVMQSVLDTAIAQLLEENPETLTSTVTLKLVNEDGAWQVLPSQELLKAVSGGL